MLLLIDFNLLPIACGSYSLFCYALLSVHSSFSTILKRKKKRIALLLLSYRCIVTITILCLFLTVQWVSLQCMVAVYPDLIHSLSNHSQQCISF